MADEAASIEGLLDDLRESASGETVSAGDIVDHFQHRSLGILLALLGLITIMPVVGDIPGAAIVCATLTLVAIVQWLRGGRSLWLPGFVRRRSLGRRRFERGIEAVRPWIRWIDRLLRPRLHVLVSGRAQRLAVVGTAAVLALLLYPLAFIPFGANAPGAGLLVLGLGLMACDGLLVLIGYGLTAVTVYVLVTGVSALPI